MGKVSNAAIEAKAKARERRVAMEKDRQARDERIDAATTVVILAQAEILAAQATCATAKSAAQVVCEQALALADQDFQDAVRAQDAQIGVAMGVLAAERLSVTQVADLTELPPTEVRRHGRNSRQRPGQNRVADRGAPSTD